MPEGWYSDSSVFDVPTAHRWHARCSAALRRAVVLLRRTERRWHDATDGGKWDVYARNHQFIIYKHGKNDINPIKNDVKSFILPCLWDLNDFKSSTICRFMAIYHILWDTIQIYKYEDLTKETVAIIISPSCLTSSPYSWKSWNNTSQPEHISMYPPVNKHRPWQIGVGRLVSTKNWWFSGSMLIYQMVFPILIVSHSKKFPLSSVSTSSSSKGSSSTCWAEGPMRKNAVSRNIQLQLQQTGSGIKR